MLIKELNLHEVFNQPYELINGRVYNAIAEVQARDARGSLLEFQLVVAIGGGKGRNTFATCPYAVFEFTKNHSHELTGTGDAYRILATARAALDWMLSRIPRRDLPIVIMGRPRQARLYAVIADYLDGFHDYHLAANPGEIPEDVRKLLRTYDDSEYHLHVLVPSQI